MYRAFGLGSVDFTKSNSAAHTSLSIATLQHLQYCIEHVLRQGIPGDLIEAGVFRGGATIYMAAVLAAYDSDRKVWVADSFQGIPPSRREVAGGVQLEECDSWEERYSVSEAEVRSNFRRYGLLDDDHVSFVPGFFNISLPPIFSVPSAPQLSIVRIDADAYDGVRDALEVTMLFYFVIPVI
jgi:hypothetical protein